MKNKLIIPLAGIAVVALVYLILLWLLPTDSFWITDGGNKFIQLENIINSGSMNISSTVPDLDPNNESFPYGGHHFQKLNDGRIYSFYPVYYPLLNVPFYYLFGFAGLYIIPFLASLGILVLVIFIVRELDIHINPVYPILVLGFCSPIFFYSLVFWEHTLSVFMTTLSFYLALRYFRRDSSLKDLFLSGLILGLSLFMREEAYLLIIAFAGAFLFTMKSRKDIAYFLLGVFLALIPYWIIQFYLYGNVLGLHAVVYSSLPHGAGINNFYDLIESKFKNFYVYLLKFSPSIEGGVLSIVLVIPIILPYLAGLFLHRFKTLYKLRMISLLIAVTAVTMLFIPMFLSSTPVFDTLTTQAFISSTPFVLLFGIFLSAMLNSNRSRIKFSSIASVLFIIMVCLSLNQDDIGIIWGPRHFLIIYPLVVLLSLYALVKMINSCPPEKKKFKIIILGSYLFLLSFFIQIEGIRILFIKKNATKELLTALEEKSKYFPDEVMVTDTFWFPEEIASRFYKEKILYSDSGTAFLRNLKLLRAKGHKRFIIVFTRSGHLSKSYIVESLRFFKLLGYYLVAHENLSEMDVALYLCKFKEPDEITPRGEAVNSKIEKNPNIKFFKTE